MSASHKQNYKPPRTDKSAFNCPYCGVLAHQAWYKTSVEEMEINDTPHDSNKSIMNEEFVQNFSVEDTENLFSSMKTKPLLILRISQTDLAMRNIWFSQCYSCEDLSIWMFNNLIWPQHGDAPLPNSDMPDDVRVDYEEASAILGSSPRGAAALLRLSVQKLCKHLGQTGGNLNDDIAVLVKKGLRAQIQQALDTIRVIGNNAVHPGQIDLRDNRATARSLFDLVNLIADSMISEPKKISKMFDNLPEGAQEAIKKRDAT